MQNIFTYKITMRNHLEHLWIIVYHIILIIAGCFYYSYTRESDLHEVVIIGICTFLVLFIPHMVMHLNYYLVNVGDVLIYDQVNEEIEFSQKSKKYKFTFNEIEFITRYKSHPFAKNQIQWFPWDRYNFSVIHLISGKRIIITSLLVPNLELPVKSNKVKLKKVFYRLPYLSDNENRSKYQNSSIPTVFLNRVKKINDTELRKIYNSESGEYDKSFIEAARIELRNREKIK